jgi:hypothetical protein
MGKVQVRNKREKDSTERAFAPSSPIAAKALSGKALLRTSFLLLGKSPFP